MKALKGWNQIWFLILGVCLFACGVHEDPIVDTSVATTGHTEQGEVQTYNRGWARLIEPPFVIAGSDLVHVRFEMSGFPEETAVISARDPATASFSEWQKGGKVLIASNGSKSVATDYREPDNR